MSPRQLEARIRRQLELQIRLQDVALSANNIKTRDPILYGRALRLIEQLQRRFRLGKIDAGQFATRRNRLTRAHYRAQHAAGASDYAKTLPD